MKEQVLKIISTAIEDLNEDLDYETLYDVNEETPIFGGEDGIDSLSLVMLVVEVETMVNESFNANVSLADEKAMSSRNSPYRNVGALTDFVLAKLTVPV